MLRLLRQKSPIGSRKCDLDHKQPLSNKSEWTKVLSTEKSEAFQIILTQLCPERVIWVGFCQHVHRLGCALLREGLDGRMVNWHHCWDPSQVICQHCGQQSSKEPRRKKIIKHVQSNTSKEHPIKCFNIFTGTEKHTSFFLRKKE